MNIMEDPQRWMYPVLRAIRCGWTIDPARRDQLVDRLVTLALDPKTKASTATKIFRALVAADAITVRGSEAAVGALTAAEMANRLSQLESKLDGLDGAGPSTPGGPTP